MYIEISFQIKIQLPMNIEIQIVGFKPQYQAIFASLNYAWMKEYELIDGKDPYLENTQSHIMDKGGQVFFAKLNDTIVGCVAIIPGTDYMEIMKLAVEPEQRGRGIGYKLLEHALSYCKKLKIKKVVLETSTKLKSAIKLYHQLGFAEIDKSTQNLCDKRFQILL